MKVLNFLGIQPSNKFPAQKPTNISDIYWTVSPKILVLSSHLTPNQLRVIGTGQVAMSIIQPFQ